MKAAPTTPRFVSFKRAEELTGISRFTWKRIADRGEIPVIRPEGFRIVRICIDDINALCERWRRDAAEAIR
jgi:hypothetical protein